MNLGSPDPCSPFSPRGPCWLPTAPHTAPCQTSLTSPALAAPLHSPDLLLCPQTLSQGLTLGSASGQGSPAVITSQHQLPADAVYFVHSVPCWNVSYGRAGVASGCCTQQVLRAGLRGARREAGFLYLSVTSGRRGSRALRNLPRASR